MVMGAADNEARRTVSRRFWAVRTHLSRDEFWLVQRSGERFLGLDPFNPPWRIIGDYLFMLICYNYMLVNIELRFKLSHSLTATTRSVVANTLNPRLRWSSVGAFSRAPVVTISLLCNLIAYLKTGSALSVCM